MTSALMRALHDERFRIVGVLDFGAATGFAYTLGLTAFHRPELLMVDVPRTALDFVNAALRYLAWQELDGPGLIVGQDYSVGLESLRARVVARVAADDPAHPLGWALRRFGPGVQVLLLEPYEEGD